MPVDVATLNVDLMSLSGHKVYGPKGVGALYVRRSPEVSIQAQMHGGGHERGMRSGTLPTHQIIGMGRAFELAGAGLDDEISRLDRKSTRLNSSHVRISYAVFCLKKKKKEDVDVYLRVGV